MAFRCPADDAGGRMKAKEKRLRKLLLILGCRTITRARWMVTARVVYAESLYRLRSEYGGLPHLYSDAWYDGN